MDIRIDLTEIDSLARTLAGKAASVEKAAATIVAAGAFSIERDMKNLVAVDTGATKNSISTDVQGLTAEVGPTTEYAPFIEGGTSRAPAQPFAGPAFDRNLPIIEKAVAKLGAGLLGK